MGGRRLRPRPSRRRFVVVELTIWLDGRAERGRFGRWVVRSTGRPKSHLRGRGRRGAGAGP
jgi:hypothetical protein